MPTSLETCICSPSLLNTKVSYESPLIGLSGFPTILNGINRHLESVKLTPKQSDVNKMRINFYCVLSYFV